MAEDGLLFVGTVEDISRERADEVREDGSFVQYFGPRRVTLTVQEVFVGAVGNEVVVKTGSGGGDCGYPFAPGVTYLVSAGEHEGGIYTSICSITSPLDRAQHMVEQFRRMKEGKRPASLYGLLSRRAYDPFTYETLLDEVLKDTSVRLAAEAGEISTRTDANGTFSFYDLPAGKYRVLADLPPGYSLLHFGEQDGLELAQQACQRHDLDAAPSGRIRGTLVAADGSPLHGIEVALKRPPSPDNNPPKQATRAIREWTDVEGRFEFDGLPDGGYALEVRGDRARRVSFRAEAENGIAGPTVFRVAYGNTIDAGTLWLTTHDQYQADFLVLWQDGAPVVAATVFSVTLPESESSATGSKRVDENGRATLPLTSDYVSQVVAEMECGHGVIRSSNPITVQESGEYVLVLRGTPCDMER